MVCVKEGTGDGQGAQLPLLGQWPNSLCPALDPSTVDRCLQKHTETSLGCKMFIREITPVKRRGLGTGKVKLCCRPDKALALLGWGLVSAWRWTQMARHIQDILLRSQGRLPRKGVTSLTLKEWTRGDHWPYLPGPPSAFPACLPKAPLPSSIPARKAKEALVIPTPSLGSFGGKLCLILDTD